MAKSKMDPQSMIGAVAQYEAGQTIDELSQQLGIPRSSLTRYLKAQGCTVRKRGKPFGKWVVHGRKIDKSGYVLVRMPAHPHASNGYMREHRLVMERVLGRYLAPEEVVHHINGQKDDNRPENLRLYSSHAEHKRDEMQGNDYSCGCNRNPYDHRTFRTRQEMLLGLLPLIARYGDSVTRAMLVPPYPSYRALNREFGSWREALSEASSLSAAHLRESTHQE